MKNNIIFLIFIIVTFVGGLAVYQKLATLESKFETLKESNIRLQENKPLTAVQLKERQFKEEMYIDQQERDTTLILSVFGIFSLLIGFLTFRSVREEFVNKINQLNEKNAAYQDRIDNKYTEIAHSYSKLENEFNLDMAETYIKRASSFLNVNNSMYVFYKLKSVNSYINALNNSLNENKLLHDSLLKTMKDQVNSALSTQNIINERIRERHYIPIENISETQELISSITTYLMNIDWDLYKEFTKTICDIRFEPQEV